MELFNLFTFRGTYCELNDIQISLLKNTNSGFQYVCVWIRSVRPCVARATLASAHVHVRVEPEGSFSSYSRKEMGVIS